MTHYEICAEDSLGRLLQDAIWYGDSQHFQALELAGPAAVEEFRAFLSGARNFSIPRRGAAIDHIVAVSCHLGSTLPEAYLAAFNSTQWITSGPALEGLGCTHRAEARPVLSEALFSTAPGATRLRAAAALGAIPGAASIDILLRALQDPDYLVQCQAIESLGLIGDRTVVDHLVPLKRSVNRAVADAATKAVDGIAERLRPPADLESQP